MSAILEICVQGIDSALAAQEGGADRIELCETLSVGGVTPSAGAIAVACHRLTIPVHVLIRPRGGGFVYSEADFEVMRRDIAIARSLGAAGVVLGVLTPFNTVDRVRLAQLVEEARPMSVTFHRAFDDVTSTPDALRTLIDLKIERVLTSGGMETAIEGLPTLKQLAAHAADRIVIMPGGRVNGPDLATLIGSGLREIHVGSAACVEGQTDRGQVSALKSQAERLTE